MHAAEGAVPVIEEVGVGAGGGVGGTVAGDPTRSH